MSEKVDDDRLFFKSLTMGQLIVMADYFEKKYLKIKSVIDENNERLQLEERNQQRINFLKILPMAVLKRINSGVSVEDAIKDVARTTNFTYEQIKRDWDKFIKSNDEKNVRARNSSIIAMSNIGIKNIEISRRFAMHEGSISRILKRYKDNPPNRTFLS